MKERFDDAKVGDKVYDRVRGFGIVEDFYELRIDGAVLPYLAVRFNGIAFRPSFCLDGRPLDHRHTSEPTLFYVDGDNKYSEQKPKLKVPWDKVPVDTKVKWDCTWNRHFAGCGRNGEKRVWRSGATSFSKSSDCDFADAYNLKLAEELTIDGITYPIGSK